MSADLYPELHVARLLIELGIPVFVAKPAMSGGVWNPKGGTGRCGFVLPREWQKTIATANWLPAPDGTIAKGFEGRAWQPGDALGAVGGHGLDFVDVDLRTEGAEASWAELQAVMPPVYFTQTSPSGGFHAAVASMDVGERVGFVPGIDLRAGRADGTGRGFIFLSPTVKLSKVTDEVMPYAVTEMSLLEKLALSDDPAAVLAADDTDDLRAIVAAEKAHPAVFMEVGEVDGLLPYNAFGGAANVKTVSEATEHINRKLNDLRAARKGYVYDALNTAALQVGHYVPSMYTVEQAEEVLRDALNTATGGLIWSPNMPGYWDETQAIAKGLRDGAATPTHLMADPPPTIPTQRLHAVASPEVGQAEPVRKAEAWQLVEREKATDIKAMMAAIPRLPREWWDKRETTKHLYAAARAARISPEAQLACHLTEVLAASDHRYVLPPKVGGMAVGSLNQYVALVGPPGAGKNEAMDTAREAIKVLMRNPTPFGVQTQGGNPFDTTTLGRVHKAKPATAQGINAMFRQREGSGKGPKMLRKVRDNVLLQVGEITSFDAIATGYGDPSGTLCDAWSGAALDARPKGQEHWLPIPEHGYRLCMITGVQPEAAAAMIKKKAIGLPQRHLWIPSTPLVEDMFTVTEETLSAHEAAWPRPEPRTRPEMDKPPSDGPRKITDYGSESDQIAIGQSFTLAELTVDRPVQVAIAAWSSKIASGDCHELDAHAGLVRTKLAAAFALSDGRTRVTVEDWDMACDLMAVSDATRAVILSCLKNLRANEDRSKGWSLAVQEHARDEVGDALMVAKADDWIGTKLTDEYQPCGPLRNNMPARLKDYFHAAMDRRVSQRRADCIDTESTKGGGSKGRRCRRCGA